MKSWFLTLLLLTPYCWAMPSYAQGTFKPTVVTVNGTLPRLVSTTNFIFTDPDGRKWTAPAGTITDGLSIPSILLPFVLPLISNVWATEYQGAALVHDAYCAEANKKGTSYAKAKWMDVHWMFFQACVAGKAPVATAYTLYSAIMIGGPKLPMQTGQSSRGLLNAYEKSIRRSSELASQAGDNSAQERQERKKQQELFKEQFRQLADTQSILDWRTETVSDSLKVAQFRELEGFIDSQDAQKLTRPRIDSVLRAAVASLQKGQVLNLPE
jgi:hypothetical protein